MILKGSQRAGAKQMALHLLKTEENEHVEIHDLRGFVSDDLKAALQESYAVSQGTRCKQFMFAVSLNPPQTENVPVEVFEGAIDAIEERLGLEGQPRAIVFHEKEGRRHAHCVWSRIDTQEMKAINLPHFKLKLRDISRQLYLENGWKMPLGLIDSRERDPTNFTRAEWQQAKRAGLDPKALKGMFQECWAASDSRKAFAKALEARGLYLARGDRRGFVALDFRGEVYAIAKYTGVRTKDVKAKLGDPQSLPSLSEAKATIAGRMTGTVKRYIKEAETAF
ncbi:MAG: relaxase/mobilization nuclease domain-containing protein, partial [Alphaproteobacteria bacterium]|nr:relaxase/mobilization nuclease domain-containing protein [Alphaproteobacteria bacterium]